MNRQGHFVWYELATPDMEAAAAFYTEVVGWRSKPGTKGGRPYINLLAGETPVAGLTTIPEEARLEGKPPHWLSYVDVENIDTSSERVIALGGRVLEGPRELEGVGRITVLTDPTGAALGLFQSGGQPMPPYENSSPQVGDITWNELNTTDWDRARSFYDALFGWREESTMELPDDMGTYWMFQAPGSDVTMGGMCNAAQALNMPPHWLPYFYVDDLGAAVKRIEARDGKVLNGPMEIPGGDHVAQCTDAAGAAFAIHGK